MYFPGILIPIVLFFGGVAWLAMVISGDALANKK